MRTAGAFNKARVDVGGLSDALLKLKAGVAKIQRKTDQGLIKAGLLLLREAVVRTPVEFGYLRNSAKCTWEEQSQGVRVAVSYSAYYAIFVHERPANHPVGDWKFLERAILENSDELLRIIRQEAMF